jgi:hypothetical protein
MDVESGADAPVSRLAAAIGEPARARILYCLMDGHQGKHRYYRLGGRNVARALEALSVLAGAPRAAFVPRTPSRLRAARTCYDHLAGKLGVAFLDRFEALRWLSGGAVGSERAYELTREGARACAALGIDVQATGALRRRFAYACLDWSERRPHLGGALGAALLQVALKRSWLVQDLDSRALEVTRRGRREMLTRFGVQA